MPRDAGGRGSAGHRSHRTVTGRVPAPRCPSPLARGSRVAVIAPGSAVVDRAALRAGLARLADLGLEPVPGRHLLARYGDLAGTDDQRAEDLGWALRSPEIDAVWAARAAGARFGPSNGSAGSTFPAGRAGSSVFPT